MDPVAYSHFIVEKTEAKKRLHELPKVTLDLIHKLDHIVNSHIHVCYVHLTTRVNLMQSSII